MSSIGTTLNNRYRLDKLIGEGGFAHVYLAADLELGRQVAIKVLDQNWVRDKDLLTRFRNEARAIAALEHPNILLIYDYGVALGAPFIVMPYVSGGTLTSRMREGPFTLDEIRFYLDQLVQPWIMPIKEELCIGMSNPAICSYAPMGDWC
jgi:serine/threonine protein kinase